MEHLAGKAIDRAIRFVHSSRMKRWEMDAAPFATADKVARFRLLATAVAGRELRVISLRGDTPPRPYLPILHRMAHPALLVENGFGWCDGESIFLPINIIDMPTEDEQEVLAKTLVFFLAAQAADDTLTVAHANRGLLSSDRLVADLYWIIENTRLLVKLSAEWQGLFSGWSTLAARLIERRPKAGILNEAERRVEWFLGQSLEAATGGRALSASAAESLELARRMAKEWEVGGLSARKYRAMVPFAPWGRLLPERLKVEALEHDGGKSALGQDKAADTKNEKPGTDREKESKRGSYVTRREEVDEAANEQGLMLNIYDKIMSWAEFVNVQRPFDDDPEEDSGSKADEMVELSTAELERTTTTKFNADLELTDNRGTEDAPEEARPAEKVFVYPEWDYRKNSFREGFSRVTEREVPDLGTGFVEGVLKERAAIIKEVRRSFEAISPERRLMTRQTEGAEIDIDAAVEAAVDLEAGRVPDDRLYISETRDERDLSVMFLIDLSMSTDAWINDRRVIDHEKEALVVLSEALEKLSDRYAVCGFSGKTNKGCSFYRIKGFDERYSEAVKGRIGSLIPQQYTRMGPAIRHATEVLRRQGSKVKLLFILSDGKPNDIDAYEGKYGIEDSRKAIKEAESWGVVPFCLTVDNEGGEYLPRIFGRGNFAVLSGIERLLKKLPELYARIVRTI